MDFSKYQPKTPAEILGIGGFGPVKAEKYGKYFTDAIQRYMNSK